MLMPYSLEVTRAGTPKVCEINQHPKRFLIGSVDG